MPGLSCRLSVAGALGSQWSPAGELCGRCWGLRGEGEDRALALLNPAGETGLRGERGLSGDRCLMGDGPLSGEGDR